MARYSSRATERLREKRLSEWIKTAARMHGDKFIYDKVSLSFNTQKGAKVEIKCPSHGWFWVTPFNHLRGEGCRECGIIKRASAKSSHHSKRFRKFFETNLANRLELLEDYKSAKEPLQLRCLLHDIVCEATPDRLQQGAIACPVCIRIANSEGRRLSLNDLIDSEHPRLPKHISILDTRFRNGRTEVLVNCDIHGDKWISAYSLKASATGCADCSRERSGYAGYRIEKLKANRNRGELTWIGVVEIEVYNIRSLKIGITTRTLEERYRWHLHKIFFSAQLREIDALLLESDLKQKFADYIDKRIFFAGMRNGSRWSGDTECFALNQKNNIIGFIKSWLSNLGEADPDYWDSFNRYQRADFRVHKKSRDKDLSNKPIKIICVENGEKFSSISEASKTMGISAGNISAVIRGERNSAGGYRWVSEKNFNAGEIPEANRERNYRRRRVICLDTLEIFPSATLAARTIGISNSHIISVCKGKRQSAGGVRWAYAEEYEKNTTR